MTGESSASDSMQSCGCFAAPSNRLIEVKELGMDSRFGEATLLQCPDCGQYWLRYFYENEAFTGSGRWFLGAVTDEQAATLTADNARATLETLDGYHYGGSYFAGRTGKGSGRIFLNP
jgi:hypothetical protein